MMLVPQRRRLDLPRPRLTAPLGGDVASSNDGMDGPDSAPGVQPTAGVTGGPQRLRPPTTSPTHGQGMTEIGAPVLGDGAPSPPLPAQLPDGNGGAVTVPPAQLAPPTGVPWSPAPLPGTVGTLAATLAPLAAAEAVPGGAATPAAAPLPWQPGTFDLTHNAINRVIEPGGDDPSRIDLATKYADIFDQATRGSYDRDRTDALNDAAAHGRVGSGMLTNRYGDLFEERQRQKDALKATLVTNATEGTIQDQRSNRNEQRTERGYQSGKAAESLAARIQRNAAEENATQSAFDNAMRMYGLGASSDPTAALLGASGRASGESGVAASGVAELLKYLMAQRASTGG